MFLAPAYLLLLILVAALGLLYAVLQLRRKQYVARFSNVALLGSVAPRRPGWRRHLTFALLLIALAVLSIGVAKPSKAVKVPRENATVMLAIDVSLSMKATDVLPSRIAAAKAAGQRFAELLPSRINLGLVSFGGAANLLSPPSLNRTEIEKQIGALQLQKSTAIGEAIFTSLQGIQVFNSAAQGDKSKAPPRKIVLLSDGTNTTGRSVTSAIAAAQKAKVQVSTIAFGTPDGYVTIDGQTSNVPADDQTLNRIARQTGGSFHTAATESELNDVYNDIGSQIGYTTEKRDISWRFLVGGVLVLFAAATCGLLWAGRIA
jgi:Ca-activated chloride channel family protein